MNEEILAGIKLLVAMAKADGRLHDNEESAIQNALDGASLGADVTIESLLKENVDVEAELGKIKSPDVRRQTYDALCAMVYVDGDGSPAEKAIIEKMRKVWELDAQKTMGERFKHALRQDFIPSTLGKIDDPVQRDKELDNLVLRNCIKTAVFGGIPVPLVGEFLVSFSQVQMLQSIGHIYGHHRDAAFWKALSANFIGATAARIAVLSLVKLIPGWGSVVGASGAFATTWAMGRATRLYFEKGEALDPNALKEAFKTARAEGVAKAKEAKSQIDAEAERVAAARKKLDDDLAAGKIAEDEYTKQVAALV